MKRGRKTWFLVILFAMMVALVGACSQQAGQEEGQAPEGEAAKEGKKTIGVTLLKENDDFYITLKKGLKQSAEEMGYDIIILSADNDEFKQDRNMDTLVLKKVDAIVICPVNSMGVGAIIKKANDKNIPVFTADIAAKSGKVVAHIASDNYQGGQIAAKRMVDLTGPGSKIAIVQQPGTDSVIQRVGGFVDTAKENGLVILEPYGNGKDDTQESERVANAAILSNPDLKGVFAANDNMAMGAEAAIIASGKDIKLIGYDAAPAAQQKIKQDGVWKADVIQYPFEIGKITVKTIDNYLNGLLKFDGSTVMVPVKVGLVDPENLNK